MYSTCLFCHGSLGRNEALEHFTVGHRIAYDAKMGRVWVVCKQCHRWNLSPIETRWEAIEDAERAFSATRLRVSTDNIALAQVREGLELVRIGKPPRLELAGWRYGNQLGARWRKQAGVAGVSSAAGAVYFASTFGQLFLPNTMQLSIAASITGILGNGVFIGLMLRNRRSIRYYLRDHEGNVVGLTRNNARGTSLHADPATGDWHLEFPYRGWNGKRYTESRTGTGTISGDPALSALGTLLPYLNRSGARESQVREAVDVIDSNASILQLFGAVTREKLEASRWAYCGVDLIKPRTYISALPSRLRLAMEMVLHEESERQALDGELAQLTARWREAEEIGKIADGLL